MTNFRQDSPIIGNIQFSDDMGFEYDEHFRMVYHFTPAFGWNNDPNGLFYKDGLWHMSYQHNPYSISWGNMSWGHSTSRDLLHWDHHGDILRPDEIGAIFKARAGVGEQLFAPFRQAVDEIIIDLNDTEFHPILRNTNEYSENRESNHDPIDSLSENYAV